MSDFSTQIPGRRGAPRAALLACASLAALAALLPSGASAATLEARTEKATAITYSTAVFNGSVNPHAQSGEYFFQYGTTRKYGSTTPVQPIGAATARVHLSQSVSGLQAFTTYHFRLVATGPSGASVGGDATFTTPKIPLSVAIVAVPNPVPYLAPFTIEGTLSGTGGGNHQVMLQASAFPFTAPLSQVGNLELTNASGGFSFPVLGATQNTHLQVSTVGTPVVSSPPVEELVAVRVSLHARHTGRRGHVRLYGNVEPAEAGALVGFQRVIPGHRTKNVGGTVVKAQSATKSSFSRVVRIKHGIYQALVKVSDGAHVSATSRPILVR